MADYYIDAYDERNLPILGNRDGQAAITGRYEDSDAYDHLMGTERPLYSGVCFWLIWNTSDHIVEQIDNVTWQGRNTK